MQPVLTSYPVRVFLVSCAVAALVVVLGAKDFVKPVAQPAKTYPAHDNHTDDKVAIAADPYDSPAKAKIFSVNFHEHGFLPIFFVVTNTGDQPLARPNIAGKLPTATR